MNVTYRPIPIWPHKPTEKRRGPLTFRKGFDDTIDLLEYEILLLHGGEVIVGAGWREQDIRMTGEPRKDARTPSHPGVEVSFNTDMGRLAYATDVCELWHHNVRSIALGLAALRDIDRYGISGKHQQYAGWLQLETSDPNASRGERLVRSVYGGNVKAALMATHPDRGGDPRDLADVQAYRQSSGG